MESNNAQLSKGTATGVNPSRVLCYVMLSVLGRMRCDHCVQTSVVVAVCDDARLSDGWSVRAVAGVVGRRRRCAGVRVVPRRDRGAARGGAARHQLHGRRTTPQRRRRLAALQP